MVGALVISAAQGSLTWETFKESLLGGTRLYCMIALILAGAAFLTLSMGYIGLPRHLAEWIATLGLSQFQLLFALMLFYIVLGCFLDGISMVVLTMGVILPTVQKAGIDLLWFGIFIVLVVEMAQITPPVGFNLFVLQGMTRREIGWIARVTLPFFFLMVAAVALIYFVPGHRHCAAGADAQLARRPRELSGKSRSFRTATGPLRLRPFVSVAGVRASRARAPRAGSFHDRPVQARPQPAAQGRRARARRVAGAAVRGLRAAPRRSAARRTARSRAPTAR